VSLVEYVQIHYLPFTSQEADAANNVVAGLQPRMSVLSPRLSRLLRGGMLWVNLTRAEGLASSAKVTKKYRAKVSKRSNHCTS